MKKSEIRKQADRIVKYLSPEYLALNKTVQNFAEPNILFKGYYSVTLTDGEKKTKLFIER